ncbi:9173_t:CDS:1 [Racocetra persica]|uniref:9173_t:CDS:1 n=1 Tax=Racocetra persica TaxID=160502 RepID=A0ACA9R849_9GLOM|nr:9173_t:CDS:1 [Racocetra persica]
MVKIKRQEACISCKRTNQRCSVDYTIHKYEACEKCRQSNPKNTVNNSFSSSNNNHAKTSRIHRRERNSEYAARQDKLKAEIATLTNKLNNSKRFLDSLEQDCSKLSSKISSLKKVKSILQSQSQIYLSPEDFSLTFFSEELIPEH